MISRRCNDDTDCNFLATLPHPVPHSTNLYPTSLLSARFLRFSPDRDAIYRIVFKSLGRHDGGKEGKRSGEKRNKRREKKEKASRKRSREEVVAEVEERGWRQPWRQLFCPGGAPPAFFMFLCPEAPFRYRPRYTACARSPCSNTYTNASVYFTSEHEETRIARRRVPFLLKQKIVWTDFSR